MNQGTVAVKQTSAAMSVDVNGFESNSHGLKYDNIVTYPAAKTVVTEYSHPLDPLTVVEVRAASEVCKAYAAKQGLPQLRFNAITLEEPPKAMLLAHLAGKCRVPRRAFCIIQVPDHNAVVEAIVTLDTSRSSVISWETLEGVQPTVTVDDCTDAEAIMKADPEFRRIVRERYGITDVSVLAVDPWYCGERFETKHDTPVGRQMMLWLYTRNGDPDDNFYAHPLDLVVDIDLNTRKVVKMWCYDKVPKIPELNRNFHRRLMDRPFRDDIKPLHVIQPEGPSFEVHGNNVSWQKWNFHVGFNFKEGLVLNNLGYEDQGRIRPIMHRASLAEIIVPYGDPRMPYARKCAFDIVDYGIGQCANSLELGCDCLGHIKYFDGVCVAKDGEPLVIKNAICMHEEDVGLAWKHVEYRNSHNESRRMRRLVLSFIATIANYEYGFYWNLYQDGTISLEVKLTGIISTNIYTGEDGPRPAYGQLVAPLLNAQHHQHFFCVRMDMAVDDEQGGKNLVVTEVNCEPCHLSSENPHGVAFKAVETVLESEKQAQRMVNTEKSRVWKVKNYNSLNPINGEPVSFKLMPFPSPPLYCHPTSVHGARGAWAQKHLWVTQYKDGELYPSGNYPLKLNDTHGIEHWTQQDRNLKNDDCVLWYNLGLTHLIRIEDFPVMPVEIIGFHVKPVNFFDCNPCIDLPPTVNEMSKSHAECCTPQSKL